MKTGLPPLLCYNEGDSEIIFSFLAGPYGGPRPFVPELPAAEPLQIQPELAWAAARGLTGPCPGLALRQAEPYTAYDATAVRHGSDAVVKEVACAPDPAVGEASSVWHL